MNTQCSSDADAPQEDVEISGHFGELLGLFRVTRRHYKPFTTVDIISLVSVIFENKLRKDFKI